MIASLATKRLLAVALTAVLLVGAGLAIQPAPAHTESTLMDVEVLGVQVNATDDFTATGTLLSVSPDTLTVGDDSSAAAKGGGGKPANAVEIRIAVDGSDAVDDGRFVLGTPDGASGVAIKRATVERDGTITVTVPSDDVLALVGGATGTHDLVLRGWWTYDRSFVVRVPVTVEAAATTTQDPLLGTQSLDGGATTPVANETNGSVTGGTNESGTSGTNESSTGGTNESSAGTGTNESVTGGTNESATGTGTNESATGTNDSGTGTGDSGTGTTVLGGTDPVEAEPTSAPGNETNSTA